MSDILITIDPGKNGGVVITSAGRFLHCGKMPETHGDLRDLLETYRECDVTVWLEKVGGFTGKEQPGSAMFNFGEGYGFIQGLAHGYRWKLVLVTPQAWQKTQGMSKNGDSDTVWKNRLKGRAQELFPHVPKITLATADALLILHHARKCEAAGK